MIVEEASAKTYQLIEEDLPPPHPSNSRIPKKPAGIVLSLLRAFYRQHLESATVSSDDFRQQGLDKYLKHRNGIGYVFACGRRWKLMQPVGRIRSTFPSTHGRRIDQLIFTEKGREVLGAKEVAV